MSNEKIKGYIRKLIAEIREETNSIIETSPNSETTIKTMMEYVSSTITARSQSIISSLYSSLSNATLSEPIFDDDVNANKFYDLDLKNKIYQLYKLDTKSLNAYKQGIDYKEVKVVYSSAASAVGGASLGAILLGALSNSVDIPLVVVIAGALLAGLGGGVAGYTVTTKANHERLTKSMDNFLTCLENDMLAWVDGLTNYYIEQVEALKKTL